MNALSKKLLTGSIAASLLIGGGLVAGDFSANAQSVSADSTTTQSQDQQAAPPAGKSHHFGPGFGFHGKNKVSQVATLLGIDEDTLKDELEQQKALAQIAQEQAGLSEDELLQKLEAAETEQIDAAVSSGKLTQEQADKIKSGLADRLKKEVESTHERLDFKRGGHGFGGMWGDSDSLAQILGITADELKSELQAGKSLTEIAQSKSISEGDLISKIKDSMTDRIKAMVERKGMPGDKDQPEPDDQTSATSAE